MIEGAVPRSGRAFPVEERGQSFCRDEPVGGDSNNGDQGGGLSEAVSAVSGAPSSWAVGVSATACPQGLHAGILHGLMCLGVLSHCFLL